MTIERAPDGKWLPGKSANPGGRLKRVREIQALAMEQTPRSFEVLFSIRDNESEDSRARIAACKEIIRYGIGEPPKAVEADSDKPPATGLTLDELRSLARQSLAEDADSEAAEDAGDDESDEPH